MEQFIQSLFSHYTSLFFIASAAWMLFFGLMMNVFVVLGVTNLSPRSAILMTYKSHLYNVCIAAFSGRLIAIMIAFILSFFSGGMAEYLNCECSSFLGMMLALYLLSSYFFCSSFATVACNVLERWLLAAHLVTGVVGYFVLQALEMF